MEFIFYPALYITPRVYQIQYQYRVNGYKVFDLSGNADEIWALLNFKFEKPIVIYDVGEYFTEKFLKFIEEVKFPVICLSSRDNINLVLLSRFAVVKKDLFLIDVRGFNSNMLLNLLDRESFKIEELVSNCANVYDYYMIYRSSRLPVKKKLLEFLL